MVSQKDLSLYLNQSYQNEVEKCVSIDIKKLSLKNVTLQKNANLKQNWSFVDIGLSEKIAALYLYHLQKNNINNYCVASNNLIDYSEKYVVCFERNGLSAIESAVKDADFIKAIYSGTLSIKFKVQEIQKHRKLTRKDVEKILLKNIAKNIKARKRMWNEMEEGIRRILGKKKNGCNISVLERGQYIENDACKIFMIHGDELRDLIQNNCYAIDNNSHNISANALMLSHYHMEMVLERFNTLVIFGGCLVSDKIGYNQELLSHLGFPTFSMNSKKICNVTMTRIKPSHCTNI